MRESVLNSKLAACAAAFLTILSCNIAYSAPILQDPSAQPDGATVSVNGGVTNINQSQDKVIINWNSFDINAGERVVFTQPGQSSVALNRVHNGLPTSILGDLTANGRIFIVNPSGMLIGAGAKVEAGSLLATSGSISDADFRAGNYKFTGVRANSSIVNNGIITSKDGFVALVGNSVSNTGTITAGLGRTYLTSAGSFTLDLSGANALISIDSDISGASTVNSGTINAGSVYIVSNADRIDLLKGAVNNTGIVTADTINISTDDGTIVLGGIMYANAAHNSMTIDGGSIASTAVISAKEVDAKSMTILDMTNVQTIGKLNASAPVAVKLESAADLNIDKISSANVALISGGNLRVNEVFAGNISLAAKGAVTAGIASAAVITASSSDVTLKLLADGNITYTQSSGKLNLLTDLPVITSKLVFTNNKGEITTDFDLVKNTDISLNFENIHLSKKSTGSAVFDTATYSKINQTLLKVLEIASENGVTIDTPITNADLKLSLSAKSGDIVLNSALNLSTLKAVSFAGAVYSTGAANILTAQSADISADGQIKLYTDLGSGTLQSSFMSRNSNIFLKEKNDITIASISAEKGFIDIEMAEKGTLDIKDATGLKVALSAKEGGSTISAVGKLGFSDITVSTAGVDNTVTIANEREIGLNGASVLDGVKLLTIAAGGAFMFDSTLAASEKLSVTAKYVAGFKNPKEQNGLFFLKSDEIFLNVADGGSFVLDSTAARNVTADLNSSNGTLNIFIKKDLVLKNLEPVLKKKPELAANANGLSISTYRGDGITAASMNVIIENQINAGVFKIFDVGNVDFSGYAAGIYGGIIDITASYGIEGIGIINGSNVTLTSTNIGAEDDSAIYVLAGSGLFKTIFSPDGNVISIYAPDNIFVQKHYKFVTTGHALANGRYINTSIYDQIREAYGENLYPMEEKNTGRFIEQTIAAADRGTEADELYTVEYPPAAKLAIYNINGKQELRAE